MIFLSLLQDVRPCDFERLMHFMYYGQVRIPNGDLESLIVTAKSLRIKGLSAPSTQFDHQHHHHQQPTQQQDLLPPPAIILPAPPQERLNKYASIDFLISKRLKKVNLKTILRTRSVRRFAPLSLCSGAIPYVVPYTMPFLVTQWTSFTS